MKKLLLFILMLSITGAMAQVTNEVQPRSWSFVEKNINEPTSIVLPIVDVEALKIEDQKLNEEGLNKTLRIGADIPVSINLFNSGAWTELSNGDRLWKLNVKSRGAYFMRAIFDLYSLPQGGELFIYNNDKTDKIGPYTSTENSETGILGTWIINGDDFWLEYYEPANVSGLGRLSIEKITHGYVDINASSKVGNLNDSFACNVDVLCDPNFNSSSGKNWTNARNNHINSVARLLISTSRGTGFCSGSMVNNTNEDGTPYFLTANHCLGLESDNAKQPDGAGANFDAIASVSFGFQWFTNTPQCASNSNTSGPSQPTRVLSGGQLRANNDDSDFALFLIDQTPPEEWDIFYSGWNNSTTAFPTTQLSIHHPSGDIMKLARNDETATKRGFNFNGNSNTQVWFIDDWEYGVTEGGSSGSMLLNQNDQIIGVLSGGSAGCSGTTDNGGFDIYGRIETAWNSGNNSSERLRDWLDPNNTSATSIDGAFASTISDNPVIEPEPTTEITVFPNPSTGLFTIGGGQIASYQVFNLNGQLILESASGVTGNQLDLSNAANGLYFVRITAGDQTVTKKIIKQ